MSFNNLQNNKYYWADDFEEMDFTVAVTWDNDIYSNKYIKHIQVDSVTDNFVIKLSKFPLEFIPENTSKRLRIFIDISYQ